MKWVIKRKSDNKYFAYEQVSERGCLFDVYIKNVKYARKYPNRASARNNCLEVGDHAVKYSE